MATSTRGQVRDVMATAGPRGQVPAGHRGQVPAGPRGQVRDLMEPAGPRDQVRDVKRQQVLVVIG